MVLKMNHKLPDEFTQALFTLKWFKNINKKHFNIIDLCYFCNLLYF